ncbi:MAG: acylphosphatase [Leptospirales bacterium]
MKLRKKVYITGKVQGVGFRPFCVRLAENLQITGFVRNEQNAVYIEAQGEKRTVQEFINQIQIHEIPQCSIHSLKSENILIQNNSQSFKIEPSLEDMHSSHFLTVPDRATCTVCLDEIKNKRRNGYVFNSCAHCGPRYSLMSGFPFDRPHTSMKSFLLCTSCGVEYANIQDRRYHAQTMSCPTCGPRLTLLNGFLNTATAQTASILLKLVDLLKSGEVIALKSTGGFHLACDALDETSVNKLRKIKNRPEKPFAVMFSSMKEIENRFQLS